MVHDFPAALRRSWEASRYLLQGLPVAGLAMLGCFLIPTGLVFTCLLIGAPTWPEIVRTLRRLASYERGRAGRRLGESVAEQYLPLDGPLLDRVRLALTDPGTWRDTLWLPAQVLGTLLLGAAALLLWPVALLVDVARMLPARPGRPARVLPMHTHLADAQARWSAALLRPSASARLAERVAELAETRAGAAEAHSAELRRIERDLHDGVQARLVALSLRIGLARQQVHTAPDAALVRLDEAQSGLEEALADLRQVVRTVYPPVLTDRGLAGAVRSLAAVSEIPITLHLAPLEDGSRLPAAVEAAAYFIVAEALTNIRKHSGAHHASVRFTRENGHCHITVTDDGHGGADENSGTGLAGIRRRTAALDGHASWTSPVGGPTELKADLPCGS
ncbi:sensor domain-containing protein [Streptomyces klenkii]|uniref:sensor histidine kinase n=1 Tax=Streptomyces klenkii TaxID=1420899 RepID=UPI0033A61BD4